MSDGPPSARDARRVEDNLTVQTRELVEPPPTPRQPPAWKRAFPKPLRNYQFGLADMFLLLTASAGLFGALRNGGHWPVALLLGLGVVAVGISMADCRNVLVGQLLGTFIGLSTLGVAAILAGPPADLIGIGVILYAPLCTWTGGVWAGWRQFKDDL